MLRAAEAVRHGENALDHWNAEWVMGYPVFHYYQHVPHLVVALLGLLLGKLIPLFSLFNFVRYVLLAAFPLSIYVAMRRFEFNRFPSACAALASSLLSTNGLYGWDHSSYVWRGYGMYSQLWGMVLLPLALSSVFVYARRGKKFFEAVLWTALVTVSHVIYGYMAVLSAWGTLIFRDAESPRRLRLARLMVMLLVAGLVISYFLVPFFAHREFLNRSPWEKVEKYDSYGHRFVLRNLFNGDLFDFGRLPIFTLLVLLGFLSCVLGESADETRPARKFFGEARHQWAVLMFVAWCLLYMGRPTWGMLLDGLPMSDSLHLHRFIAGVHFGGILLIGVAAETLWQKIHAHNESTKALACAALWLLVLMPVYYERTQYLKTNQAWAQENERAFAQDRASLDALFVALENLQRDAPGRVYAGLPTTWGKDFRVGVVPLYALLSVRLQPTLGYLYHSMSLPGDVQGYFDESHRSHYELFNVRYVIAPLEHALPGFVERVQTFGRFQLARVPTRGYFELANTDLKFLGDQKEFYRASATWLGAGGFQQHAFPRMVRTQSDHWTGRRVSSPDEVNINVKDLALPNPTTFARGEPPGSVLKENKNHELYSAEVEATQFSSLVFKMTFHPWWRARVDGKPVRTYLVAPGFLSLDLTPGRHRIELEYRPAEWKLALFVFGVLILGVVAWDSRRAKIADPFAYRVDQWLAQVAGLLARIRPRLKKKAPDKTSESKDEITARWAIASVFLCAGLAGLPLLQSKVLMGHDVLEYLPRVQEFYAGLEAGKIWPRWAPHFAGGYGEPFFMFSPPLFYYLVSLLHWLGFNFLHAINVACLVTLIASGLAMYLFAREFFSREGSALVAAAYIFAPYTLTDLYVRANYMEFVAFPFLPLIFWSLARLQRQSSALAFWVGAASLALLTLTSNPIALIVVPIIFLYILVVGFFTRNAQPVHASHGPAADPTARSRSPFARTRWTASMLTMFAVGLCLSAFFWLPAFLDRNWVHIDRLYQGHLNFRNHFVYFRQLLDSPWGYGLSVAGPKDGMSFQLGFAHLAVFGLTATLMIATRNKFFGTPSERSRRLTLHIVFMIGVAIFGALLSTTAAQWIWEQSSTLQVIQFPWRFHILAAFAMSLLFGTIDIGLRRFSKTVRQAGLAISFGVILLFNLPHAQPQSFQRVDLADFRPEKIARDRMEVVTAREYRPMTSLVDPAEPAVTRFSVLVGNAQIVSQTDWWDSFHATIRAEEACRIRANVFDFPGWQVIVDGQQMNSSRDSQTGLIEFSLTPGLHSVAVRFLMTSTGWLGVLLSLLGLTLLITLPFFLFQSR